MISFHVDLMAIASDSDPRSSRLSKKDMIQLWGCWVVRVLRVGVWDLS